MVAMEPWRWKWLWEPSVHLALLQGPSSPHLLKALPVTPAPSAHHPWELHVNCVSCSVVYMGSVCVFVSVSVLVIQSCLTLYDLMDCTQPGSSIHGILQTRILEWVAMPSSRRTSQSRDQTHVSYVSGTGRWVLYH